MHSLMNYFKTNTFVSTSLVTQKASLCELSQPQPFRPPEATTSHSHLFNYPLLALLYSFITRECKHRPYSLALLISFDLVQETTCPLRQVACLSH